LELAYGLQHFLGNHFLLRLLTPFLPRQSKIPSHIPDARARQASSDRQSWAPEFLPTLWAIIPAGVYAAGHICRKYAQLKENASKVSLASNIDKCCFCKLGKPL
jgi:hypothetical protein